MAKRDNARIQLLVMCLASISALFGLVSYTGGVSYAHTTSSSAKLVSAQTPADNKPPCVPNAKDCAKLGPKLLTLSDTGQQTVAKPTLLNCLGSLYVGWAGTDNRVNIGWGSTSGPLPHVATFNELAYAESNLFFSRYSGVALECYLNRIYLAWTGMDHHLNVGWFNGVQNTVQNKVTLGDTSDYTPALAAISDGYLRLAWTGQDSNHRLNLLRSSNGTSWPVKNVWTSESSAGGLGLENYCPSGGYCGTYISWIGTDPQNTLNVGYWNSSAGSFVLLSTLIGLRSQSDFDAELVNYLGFLCIPYASAVNDLEHTCTADRGAHWDNDSELLQATYGAGGAQFGTDFWVAWHGYSRLELYIGIARSGV